MPTGNRKIAAELVALANVDNCPFPVGHSVAKLSSHSDYRSGRLCLHQYKYGELIQEERKRKEQNQDFNLEPIYCGDLFALVRKNGSSFLPSLPKRIFCQRVTL